MPSPPRGVHVACGLGVVAPPVGRSVTTRSARAVHSARSFHGDAGDEDEESREPVALSLSTIERNERSRCGPPGGNTGRPLAVLPCNSRAICTGYFSSDSIYADYGGIKPARPEGFEPPTPRFVVCNNPLIFLCPVRNLRAGHSKDSNILVVTGKFEVLPSGRLTSNLCWQGSSRLCGSTNWSTGYFQLVLIHGLAHTPAIGRVVWCRRCAGGPELVRAFWYGRARAKTPVLKSRK
jgi:hypothetical protein